MSYHCQMVLPSLHHDAKSEPDRAEEVFPTIGDLAQSSAPYKLHQCAVEKMKDKGMFKSVKGLKGLYLA